MKFMKAKGIILVLAFLTAFACPAKASEGLRSLSPEELGQARNKTEIRASDKVYKNDKDDYYIIGEDGFARTIFSERQDARIKSLWTVEKRIEDLMDKKLIPEDYSIGENYDDGDLIQVRLYKDLEDGIENFYDSYGLSFFKNSGEIKLLARMDEFILKDGQVEAQLSKDEAQDLAKNWAKEEGQDLRVTGAKLAVASTESLTEVLLNEPNYIEGPYYLEYMVNFDDGSHLSIDARSSKAIIYGAVESIDPGKAKDVLELYGPTRFDTGVEVTKALFKEGVDRLYLVDSRDIEWSLKEYIKLEPGPVLLYDGEGLSKPALDEVIRLKPKEIHIIGPEEGREGLLKNLEAQGIDKITRHLAKDKKDRVLVGETAYPDMVSALNLTSKKLGIDLVKAGDNLDRLEGVKYVLGGGLAYKGEAKLIKGDNRCLTSEEAIGEKKPKSLVLVGTASPGDWLMAASLVNEDRGVLLVNEEGLSSGARELVDQAEEVITIGGRVKL